MRRKENFVFCTVALWILLFYHPVLGKPADNMLAPGSLFGSASRDDDIRNTKEKEVHRLFADENQVRVLRQRIDDRGYVYPGDEIMAYVHGIFAGPSEFKLEYPKNGPPILRLQLPRVLGPVRGSPQVHSRIKKAVGERVHVLDDIEIEFGGFWITLRKYFSQHPPTSLFGGNYSLLWENEPEGNFYSVPDGHFTHRRTDSQRVFKINWQELSSYGDLSDVKSLPVALRYYVTTQEELQTSFKQVREWYSKKPFDFSILVVDASGNGKVFIPYGDRLEERKIVSLHLVLFEVIPGSKQPEINSATTFPSPVPVSL